MRIEGDGDGFRSENAGSRDDLGDNALMAAMHAVEVADGQHGAAEVMAESRELSERSASGELEGDLQAVVGEAHVGGQCGFGLRVVELVAMCVKKARRGFIVRTSCDDLFNDVVAGVWFAAQRVDDEHIKILRAAAGCCPGSRSYR